MKTVGALPQGVPAPSLPWTSISDVGPLLLAAVGITLVSLTDTIATSTSFAAKRGDEVQPDQEMIGIGVANIAAGFFQGFAVSTSGSRTAVAEESGAKSQVTGLVGAAIVVVLLLFLNGLLADLPQTTLAAVVIVAAISLMDWGILGRYYRVRKTRARALAGRHPRRRLLRGPRRHPGGGLPGDPAVLPAQLVAARRRARADGGGPRVAQRRDLPGRRAGAGHRRVPLGGAAVLRQRRPLPRAGPRPRARPSSRPGSCSSARRSPTSTSPPPGCSSSSTRSSTPSGSTWRSPSCATASRTSFTATGSSRPSTATTSIPTIKAAVKEVQAIGPLPPSHDAAGRHARHEVRPKVDHGKHDHGRHRPGPRRQGRRP